LKRYAILAPKREGFVVASGSDRLSQGLALLDSSASGRLKKRTRRELRKERELERQGFVLFRTSLTNRTGGERRRFKTSL